MAALALLHHGQTHLQTRQAVRRQLCHLAFRWQADLVCAEQVQLTTYQLRCKGWWSRRASFCPSAADNMSAAQELCLDLQVVCRYGLMSGARGAGADWHMCVLVQLDQMRCTRTMP